MSPADDFLGQEESSAGQFDFGQVLGFLGRHRWWIAGTTVLALVPALFVPTIPADLYQASARVTVQARPEAMRLGADITPGERQVRYGTNPLTRERLMVLSDHVLGKVIDQMPEGEALEPTLLAQIIEWVSTLGREPVQYTPEQMRKARVDGLRQALVIELGDSGDILEVGASASDPVTATYLANAVADALVDYSKGEQSEGYERTVSWLNAQVLELRERVNVNQGQLGKHVAKHGILAEQPSKEGAAPTGRAALLDDLTRSEIELQSVRARMRELPVQQGGANGETEYDPELVRVQQRYDTARASLEEARLTYTPTHPEVRRREAVARGIEKELEAWGPQMPLTSVNAADQAEYRQLVQQEAGLRARTVELRRRVEELAGTDSEKTRAIGEYERLNRQLTLDRDMLDLLMRKREEVVLAAAADYTRARVLDRAVEPIAPVGPNRLRILLVGLALALVSGVGAAAVREFLDQTLRDPEEARRLFGVPVIAMVPFVKDAVAPERHSEGSPSSLPAESYRNLRTALLFASASQGFTTIVVTSGLAGEGKTTVSVNLASSFAQVGRSVLLIDADMRRPRVHRVFGIGAAPGLSEVLRGDSSLDAAVRRPGDGPFDVLSSGQQPANPSELLASPQFSMLLARVRTQYDLVIIDSPVLLGVSDTHLLTSQADATLLVQRPGSLQRRGAREVRVALQQSGARVLGVVFNQVPRSDRQFYPAYMESPYLSTGWREKQAQEG
jgi:succinoglycan biosynthesis transport protein ExoP